MDRLFALKRLLPSLTADPACAQALSAAARSYSSLEHPRIARLAELTVTQGQTFTATELVTGLDVGRLVAECRISGSPLPPGSALGLLIGAARAVGYAHGRGLLHLGLCPQNLVVSVDGEVKVTDFGILAACMPPRPAEDPRLSHRVAYLAPEQLVGEPTSAATDVFALGAIGIEMVTGSPAFRGETPLDVQQAVLSGRVNDPSLPGSIVRVLQRCLARAPFERFPDARALADALEATLRTTPVRGSRLDVSERVNAVLAHLASLHEGGLSGVVSLPGGSPAVAEVGPPPVPPRPPTVLGPEVISTLSSLQDHDRLDTAEFLREDAFDEDPADSRPMPRHRQDDTSDDPQDQEGGAVAAVLETPSRGHRVTDAPMIAATLRGFSSGATPRPMPPSPSGPVAAPAAATPPPRPPPRPLGAPPPSVPLGGPPRPLGGPPPSVPLGAPPRPLGAPPPSVPLGAPPPSVPLGAPPRPPAGQPGALGAPPPSVPLGAPPRSGPLPSITGAGPFASSPPPGQAGGREYARPASFATVIPSRSTSQAEPRAQELPVERRSLPQLSETRAGSSGESPDVEVTTARVGALVSAWDEAMETFEQPTRVSEVLNVSLMSAAHRTSPAPRLDLAELLAPAEPPVRQVPAPGSFDAMASVAPYAGGPQDLDPWAPVASVSTVFPESVPRRPSAADLGPAAAPTVEVAPQIEVESRPWPSSDPAVRPAPLAMPSVPPTRPSQSPMPAGAFGLGAPVRTTAPMSSPPPYPQAPPPGGSLISSPFGSPTATESLGGSRARWLWLLIGVIIIAASGAGAYAVFFGGFSSKRGTLALPATRAGDAAVAEASPDARLPVGQDGGAIASRSPVDAAVVATGAAPVDAQPPTSIADAALPTTAAPPVAGAVHADGEGLAIESTPAGARVYIDGADQGVTPLRLPGPPDRHSAVLFLAGHELSTLEVDKSGTYKVVLKEITPLGGPAGIKVRCKVKERYYIYIDGKPTGSLCPSERLEVERGERVVEIYDLVTEARRQFRVMVKDTSRSTRVRVD